MDRIVITIRPSPSDDNLLRVADAMQQVMDAIRVIEQAGRALVSPQNTFEWRLERAATASPFTVVAVADPVNPTVDVTAHVRRVKSEVSRSLRELIERGQRPAWMDAESIRIARNLFTRNQNGVGQTDIDFDPESEAHDVVSIDREVATAGIRAIVALNPLDIDADLPADRESFGEVEGVMLAAGRFWNRPAIQIRSELYGFVWCILPEAVIKEFGDEHSVADIWKGKTVAVLGRLNYASGKLRRVESVNIREVHFAAPLSLESILDPDFTSGMHPTEYLDRLHAGELG